MLLGDKLGKCILTHNVNVTFYRKKCIRTKLAFNIQVLNNKHARTTAFQFQTVENSLSCVSSNIIGNNQPIAASVVTPLY